MMWMLLLIIPLAFFVYSYYKAYKYAYELNHPRKACFTPNICIPITYKKFDFKTDTGLLLKGIDIKPKMNIKGTILVCHYLSGSKELILTFVDYMLRIGFRVITFDFRNHGESHVDKRIRFSLEEDFDAFYKYIKNSGIEGPFGVIGFSMGATPALYGFYKYPEIKAAVIDSGPLLFVKKYFLYLLDNKKILNMFYKVSFLLIYLYHAGFNRMSRKTIAVLKALRGRPVLLVHGEKDNVIPLENARAAHEYLGLGPDALWEIPNSRHLTNRFIRKEEYEKRISEFFISNLSAGD